MATGQSKVLAEISRPTARDLSTYQYYAGCINSDGDVDYADSSAGTEAIGPITNKPDDATGAEASLAIAGTALLIVDGTANGGITAGASYIGSNSAYKGVNVTADNAYYFALALESSSAANDIIEVLLCGPSYISAGA
ncbi:MAG: hypothetical protein WCY09_09300 [Candidatus Omnitrophota bacterium]|jgi:hypothetical protein